MTLDITVKRIAA